MTVFKQPTVEFSTDRTWNQMSAADGINYFKPVRAEDVFLLSTTSFIKARRLSVTAGSYEMSHLMGSPPWCFWQRHTGTPFGNSLLGSGLEDAPSQKGIG